MKYDVIVVGGGVVGAAILDRLAMTDLKCLLLEAEDDVASGASRANSGILHAGYDTKPGTLKARFNKEGNDMFLKIAEDLDVPFSKTGSIVVGTKEQLPVIEGLKARGIENGVETKILSREEILKLEPNIADDIEYALYAKTAAVVSPYKMNIALIDRAVLNGAEVKTNQRVVGISKSGGVFIVKTETDVFEADLVVNATGAGADALNRAAGAEEYDVYYQKGEYFVLDERENRNVNTIVFPLPSALGKGILVIPTADGNVLYGPTATLTDNKDTAVSFEGLEKIKQQLKTTYKAPAYGKTIRLYAGIRAITGEDFVVEKSQKVDGFIYLLGICSPGFSAAPAIAKYVVDELISTYKSLVVKKNAIIKMPVHKKIVNMSADEISKLVSLDERWGRVVCRCQKVTEAEVVNAIHSPLPAVTVDAVKKRVRAGMGRCQGGFCTPRVINIIARETGIPVTEVKKGGENSEIALMPIKSL